MSYYKDCFKYKVTHHAKRRLRERTDFKNMKDHEIGYFIERTIEDSIVKDVSSNGDITYLNMINNITIVVTKDNVVKTIINNLKK